MIAQNNQPKVYSYIRFSTPEQELGDSERRQMAKARQIAEEKGLELDETLTDRGLSGYYGENIKKGKLGAFLKAIKKGLVAPGSFLIVENIDRLTRSKFTTAFKLISEILEAKITVITCYPDWIYTEESVNTGHAFLLVGQILYANAESQKKSDRIGESWKQNKKTARATGRPYAGMKPHWLRIVKNGQQKHFEVIEEAVDTYRKIFELRAEGWGLHRITNELNSGKYWMPPKNPKRATVGWRDSYIQKTLRNKALIGELQPMNAANGVKTPDGERLKKFYPPIIESALFYRVQKLLDKRAAAVGRGGGRVASFPNIFRSIAVCAYCGNPMHFHNDSNSTWKSYKMLYCDAYKRKSQGCHEISPGSRMMQYEHVKTLILENMPKIKPEQILPAKSDSEHEVVRLKGMITSVEGEREEWQRQRNNLMQRIRTTSHKNLQAEYESQVVELDQQISESLTRESKIRSELANAEKDSRSVLQWQQTIEQLRKLVDDPERIEVRERLNQHLLEFIEKIEIFSDGHFATEPSPDYRKPKKKYRKGESKAADFFPPARHDDFEAGMLAILDETNSEFLENERYLRFLSLLQRQRLTRMGSFIRVWFKSGATVDLVPPKSLASGMRYGRLPEELCDDENGGMGWRFVGPDIEDRWRIFKMHGRKAKAPQQGKPIRK